MNNRSLFNLRNLKVSEIMDLINLAIDCEAGKFNNIYSDKIVANLFFEPSTRTQYSFETAELKLGIKPINFNPETSSIKKGESFYDTIKTFESFQTSALIIRSNIDKYYEQLNKINVPIINAGDGVCDHPSQSLLDLYTIYKQFKTFKDIKIAIVGDIKHSRVAHTNLEIMERLGMKTYISGPEIFNDHSSEYIDFDQAIEEMDVIMLLRIQHERHHLDEVSTVDNYHQNYGLNTKRMNRMKHSSIIMHPAPFNRGVEISDEVVECDKSRIFQQIKNGVYIRMAILITALETEGKQ